MEYTVYRTQRNDDLLQDIKIRAAKEKKDIIDIVEIALKHYLKTPVKKIQRGAK